MFQKETSFPNTMRDAVMTTILLVVFATWCEK